MSESKLISAESASAVPESPKVETATTEPPKKKKIKPQKSASNVIHESSSCSVQGQTLPGMRSRTMKFTLPVSGVECEAEVIPYWDALDRKMRVDGRHIRHPDRGTTRGTWKTYSVFVKSVMVRLDMPFPSGGLFRARSCCKPPDVFDFRVGKQLAVRRLMSDPSLQLLCWEDRLAIREQLLGIRRRASQPKTGDASCGATEPSGTNVKRLATSEEASEAVRAGLPAE